MPSSWLKQIALFPLFLLMGTAGDQGAGNGDSGSTASGASLSGSDGAATGDEASGAVEEIFTPEEITAKKESIAAARAEEQRRAALTPAERDAEDREAESRKAREEKEQAGAPESYSEFTRPEGMENVELNQTTVDALKPIARDLNLSQEKAQTLFARLLTDVYPKMEAQRLEAWGNLTRGWADAAREDKEIGGDKWEANVAIAQRALNTFGGPELKEALNQYGLGNHPELIRLMVRMGKAMREDTIVLPGSQAGGARKSTADVLYGEG